MNLIEYIVPLNRHNIAKFQGNASNIDLILPESIMVCTSPSLDSSIVTLKAIHFGITSSGTPILRSIASLFSLLHSLHFPVKSTPAILIEFLGISANEKGLQRVGLCITECAEMTSERCALFACNLDVS